MEMGPVTPTTMRGWPLTIAYKMPQIAVANKTSVTPSCPSVFVNRNSPNDSAGAILAKNMNREAVRIFGCSPSC